MERACIMHQLLVHGWHPWDRLHPRVAVTYPGKACTALAVLDTANEQQQSGQAPALRGTAALPVVQVTCQMSSRKLGVFLC